MKAEDEEIIRLLNEINDVRHNETNQPHQLLSNVTCSFSSFQLLFLCKLEATKQIRDFLSESSLNPTLMLANMDQFGGFVPLGRTHHDPI